MEVHGTETVHVRIRAPYGLCSSLYRLLKEALALALQVWLNEECGPSQCENIFCCESGALPMRVCVTHAQKQRTYATVDLQLKINPHVICELASV